MHEHSEIPKRHPDCCLSLSTQLLHTIKHSVQSIAQRIQVEVLLMSVGCGTGFF